MVGHANNSRFPAQNAAWLKDGVAPYFGKIAHQSAELAEACGHATIGSAGVDFVAQELEIGADNARAKVGLVAQDGVAHVVEMGSLHFIEQEGVLVFAGVAKEAAAACNDVAADVYARPKLAIRANPGGALYAAEGRELD